MAEAKGPSSVLELDHALPSPALITVAVKMYAIMTGARCVQHDANVSGANYAYAVNCTGPEVSTALLIAPLQRAM